MRIVALALLTAAAVLAGPVAGPARADDGERVRAIDVRLYLQRGASMHVTEKISYDFGGQDKHGIYRYLPLTRPFEGDRERVYPITGIRVSSPTGAPDHWERTADDPVTIRIGEEGRTTRGLQVYELSYDLAGVVDVAARGPELYWNVVGDGWQVPVDEVTVTLMGPPGTGLGPLACYRGPAGSTAPCSTEARGAVAAFSAQGLQPHEGLTVVARLPVAPFGSAKPVLLQHWSAAGAFALTPVTGGVGGAVLLLIGGGAGVLARRRGRDHRYLGVVPGLAPAPGQQVRTARVGRRRPPVAVRFTPPDGVRVGEAGTLIDERADVVDVTATIVDLAVRGYLRIEEVAHDPHEGYERDDWRLVRTDDDVPGLRGYERTLYESIFADRREVTLSQLRRTFRDDLSRAQDQLYQEVVARGWFLADPRPVRRAWYRWGGRLLGAGVGATVLLAWFTDLALVGVALTLSGLVVLLLARRTPARTAAGTAVLEQVNGFRLYLEKAEADEIRFEEGQDVFSRYLPYAIVFGVAQRWAGVFAGLAARSAVDTGWYRTATGSGEADLLHFGSTVSAFSTTASASIAAFAAPSGSSSGSSDSSWGGDSGFDSGSSGGGGGGGGGGSW